MRRLARFLLRIAPLAWGASALAQTPGFNYDEAKVGTYTLPDPLVALDGSRITTAEDWKARRRPELLAIITEQMYGKAPGRPADLSFQVRTVDRQALGGKATRKEIRVLLTKDADGPHIDLLTYRPNAVNGPAPAFLGLNFKGNHTTIDDPAVAITESWVPNDKEAGIADNRSNAKVRGSQESRWQIATAIDRGYAVATAYYGDIDPDYDDGFQNGVHPIAYKEGQTKPDDDEWGSVAAWAWGLSRLLDYLQADPEIDARRVAVMGHSRLGKAALWAGATDERFALAISNDSGESGAALARRDFGETVARINSSFPHWFNANYKRYNGRPNDLPFDQHEVIALIAPRPVLVTSAVEDLWADPKGEFLGAKGADPVYRLLGTDGLAASEMPGPNEPILSTIGYQIRPGKHDVTADDWRAYLDFADRHLKAK